MPSVNIDEFEDAVEWVSSPVSMNEAYLCRATGRIYLVSDEFDDSIEGELPSDLEDVQKYMSIPDKQSLDLGSALVFKFARAIGPDYYQEISDTFRRKGAYSRFKGLLEREGLLEDWFEYEKIQSQKSFVTWCETNGFDIEAKTKPEEASERDEV